LQKLNRELGLTIILVEHRLEEVMPIVDRVLLMEKGSIVYNDKSIVKVTKKPESKAVVFVDGNKMFEMSDAPITISKSFSRFKLCLIKNEFFKRLKIKLSRVDI